MARPYKCTECNKLVAKEKDGKLEVQCSRCGSRFSWDPKTGRWTRTVRGRIKPKGGDKK